MMTNATVGRRIRQQREKLGLKQHDLAHALQVSPQAVSKWGRGENAPDIALLVPLAKLLGVSTDSLLGYHEDAPPVFAATVCFAMVAGYAPKAQTIPAKDLAAWANGFFWQLTEAMLHHDGIPVKYMGDTFLGFFAGPQHQRRALQAVLQARQIVSEPLTMALHSGEIYLGAIGHPDYARPDIMGDTVNVAFLTMEWAAGHAAGKIAVTAAVVAPLDHAIKLGAAQAVEFRGIKEPVLVHEVLT